MPKNTDKTIKQVAADFKTESIKSAESICRVLLNLFKLAKIDATLDSDFSYKEDSIIRLEIKNTSVKEALSVLKKTGFLPSKPYTSSAKSVSLQKGNFGEITVNVDHYGKGSLTTVDIIRGLNVLVNRRLVEHFANRFTIQFPNHLPESVDGVSGSYYLIPREQITKTETEDTLTALKFTQIGKSVWFNSGVYVVILKRYILFGSEIYAEDLKSSIYD